MSDPALLNSASSVLSSLSSSALYSGSTPPASVKAALAYNIAFAASAVVVASGPAMPSSTAATLVSALSAALASTAVDVLEPTTPPPGFNATSSVPPFVNLYTGGSPTAVVAQVTTTLNLLTSALLSAVPAGQIVPIATPPDDAFTPGGTYCGAAVSSRAVSVVAGALLTVSTPTLNPCSSTTTLPDSVLISVAAPSIEASARSAAALSGAVPGAALTLTQWGVSPFPETSIIVSAYPAPPSLSDLDLAATTAAAQALASAPARRLARALGVTTALDAVIAATGGTSAASASSSALTDPSMGGTPRPTTAIDLLPSRPLDSRVISVGVLNRNGTAVNISRGVFTYDVVVPLRDLSIIKWDRTLQSATVDVGNSGFAQPTISVTCPLSPAAAARGIKAVYVVGGSGAASVQFVSSRLASYTDVVGSVTTAGSGGDTLANVAAPGSAAVSTDLLALPKINNSSDSSTSIGAVLTAKAPTFAASAFTYVLSFDCGPAFGAQNFACGVGSAGKPITFVCPRVVAVPSCLRYNSTLKGWQTTGCSVVSSSVTSVTCKCDAPGNVAVRFASLAQQQIDVFAVNAPATSLSILGVFTGTFAFLIVAFTVNFFGVLVPSGARTKRWLQHLTMDSEIGWLRRVSAGTWSIAGEYSAGGAKVAPEISGDGRGTSKSPPARVAPEFGDASSKNAFVQRLGDSLKTWAGPLCVAPPREGLLHMDSTSGPPNLASRAGASDVALLLRIWRAVVAKARSDTTEKPKPPSLPTFTIVSSLVFNGEPPCSLLAVWPLIGFIRARSPYFVDEAGSALAAPPLSRLFGSLASIAASGAGTVVLYAYLLAVSTTPGSPAFAALSGAQMTALAFASALLIQAPIDTLVLALLRWRTRAAAHWRFPGLSEEMARRTRAASVLGPLPTSALLRLVGAMGGSPTATLTETEAADADAGAPPGWDAEPPESFVNTCPGLLSLFGRHPDQRAELAEVSASAAWAAGLAAATADAESPRALIDSSVAAAATMLAAAYDATPAPSKPSVFLVVLVDVALAGIAGFSIFYATAFSLTRGPAATSSALLAWVVGLIVTIFVVRPAAIALRVEIAFASAGALRRRVESTAATTLFSWHHAVAVPSASAAAAGGGAAMADAAITLVAPETLAAVAYTTSRAGGEFAAHIALRGALFVRAYLLLESGNARDHPDLLLKGAAVVTNAGSERGLDPTLLRSSSSEEPHSPPAHGSLQEPALNDSRPSSADALDVLVMGNSVSVPTARLGENSASMWAQRSQFHIDPESTPTRVLTPVHGGVASRAQTPLAFSPPLSLAGKHTVGPPVTANGANMGTLAKYRVAPLGNGERTVGPRSIAALPRVGAASHTAQAHAIGATNAPLARRLVPLPRGPPPMGPPRLARGPPNK